MEKQDKKIPEGKISREEAVGLYLDARFWWAKGVGKKDYRDPQQETAQEFCDLVTKAACADIVAHNDFEPTIDRYVSAAGRLANRAMEAYERRLCQWEQQQELNGSYGRGGGFQW